MTDLDRIPQHLRDEVAALLPFARALDTALIELCERYGRLEDQWDTGVHPSLGDEHGDLDRDLMDDSGLNEIRILLNAVKMRAEVAAPGDPRRDDLERFGVTGWGLDNYRDQAVELRDSIDYLQRCGELIAVGDTLQKFLGDEPT